MINLIKHYPVMLKNVIKKIKSQKSYQPIKIADCNFGFGGHSLSILKTFPQSLVQGYDLDPEVINYFLNNYLINQHQTIKNRLTITNANFSSITQTKIYDKYQVILADFGFNSFHLERQRGFTWRRDQKLDMRYSNKGITCEQIINQSSQLELMSILSRFGQLKGGNNIAKAIISSRPIATTGQLRDAVARCFRDDKPRRIAQVFQSFRIATNKQLQDIQKLCYSLDDCLDKNGLFIAITFHSLEREIIYNFLHENKQKYTKLKLEEPSKEQLLQNSKSNSAKMLSFSKII